MGDPLMPALFPLAQHRAFVEAAGRLQPTERIFAYLDDLYVLTTRFRARAAFECVAEAVERIAGVRTHIGKFKAWARGGGAAPEDFQALEA